MLAARQPRGSRLLLLDGRAGTLRQATTGPIAPWGIAAASDLVWVSSLCGRPACDVSPARPDS